MTITLIIIIYMILKNNFSINNLNIILLILGMILFQLLSIYSIVYKLYLKDKKIEKLHYCITNYRALLYDGGKDVLKQGLLREYKVINCENVKQGYGDLFMSKLLDESDDEDMVETLISQNSEMIFEAIREPNEVKRIIDDAIKNN